MRRIVSFFKRRKNKRGFSLVEVIVATAIVVVISTTMLRLFSQGSYYIGRANALRVQASEANESIKLAKKVSSSDNTVTYGSTAKYKIKTSLEFGKKGETVRTGGSSQEYIFILASSSNAKTETKIDYADFVEVDPKTQ